MLTLKLCSTCLEWHFTGILMISYPSMSWTWHMTYNPTNSSLALRLATETAPGNPNWYWVTGKGERSMPTTSLGWVSHSTFLIHYNEIPENSVGYRLYGFVLHFVCTLLQAVASNDTKPDTKILFQDSVKFWKASMAAQELKWNNMKLNFKNHIKMWSHSISFQLDAISTACF